MEGEPVKSLNRGGTRGVRHIQCAHAISACPYVVDLTESLQTEDLPATRNEDLFPNNCGASANVSGQKRSFPATPVSHSRDPRTRRA